MTTGKFIKSMLSLPLIIVVVVMSIISCSNNEESDSISIVSVYPNAGLADGVDYDFTVVVDYKLVTKKQGELDIGFNNGSEINSYYMLNEIHIVNQGGGQHTFNVTATAKYWGFAGDFSVYVYISEYPHGDQWEPLDYDIMTLNF